MIVLPHPYPLSLPMVCGLWWHALHMQSSSCGTSPIHAELLVPLFMLLYFHSTLDRLLLANTMGQSIALSGSLILCHICNLDCPLPAVGQCLVLLKMHQFPDAVASWYHSISCNCLLLAIWLFCICLDMFCSMSIQLWQISASKVVYIPLQSLVRMHSGNLLYPGITTVLFCFGWQHICCSVDLPLAGFGLSPCLEINLPKMGCIFP